LEQQSPCNGKKDKITLEKQKDRNLLIWFMVIGTITSNELMKNFVISYMCVLI